EMHYPVFWPAWYSLPSLHPIVRNLAPAIGATALGGILITRIPPGGEVKPHIDGGWHATFFNFKAYICLRGNPLCLNWCEDEPFNARAGDVFEFSNLKTHSVVNAGKTDRITAIVCFRTES
ncbi:MAG: aspartyl beta-hydroxylase, partial [Spirosoma sp.]|nr:aspartyl beta-hydroxylase [Spirosoma sp.]